MVEQNETEKTFDDSLKEQIVPETEIKYEDVSVRERNTQSIEEIE